MKYTPKTKEGEELIFYNYKEPLKPIEEGKGFGYYGVLLSSKDETKVQCHICGLLFESLSGHIRQNHNLKVAKYKERYQLAHSTALVSEKRRLALKARTIEWLNSLSQKQRDLMRKNSIKSLAKYLKEHGAHGKSITLETKNKRGTCPDQLIDKVKKVAEALGHSPSKNEFIDFYKSQKYVHIILKTFGTWNEVKRRAGLDLLVTSSNGKAKKHRYTKEEIIDYMKLFYQENKRPPTTTDCNRGLIPHQTTIKRIFGSMQEARLASGITDPVGRWKDRN